MRLSIPCGDVPFELQLPDRSPVEVVAPPPADPLAPGPEAMAALLERPVGCQPLSDLAKTAKRACILVCDVTRPVPNGLLLPPLLHRLHAAGLDRKSITVLVATGLHRPNEGPELANVLGDPSVERLATVENHRAGRTDEHVETGRFDDGTPVLIDRRLVEADLRIAIGLVEPHFMAGWSGGRKLILPGVAGTGTIRSFHAARLLSSPGVELGRLDGNPVHRLQLAVAAALGPVCGLNVVLDDRRRPLFINFGELVAAHEEAVGWYRRHRLVQVARRFPVVVTSAAGAPLDATWYQGVKAVVSAVRLLEPGGSLFVVAGCAEGLGSDGFARAQRRLIERGPDRFLNEAAGRRLARPDEWQSVMLARALGMAGEVRLYAPGLAEQEWGLTGVGRCRDPGIEIAACLDRLPDPRLAVVPDGPYTLAMVDGGGADG